MFSKELLDKIPLETLAKINYFSKAIKKRKRRFLLNLEKITREYEETVKPLLKEVSEKSASIPLYWAIALGSFQPLHRHIEHDDIPYLTHIKNITYQPRPRFSDGFYLAIHLDEPYKGATLIRSYALHSTQRMLPLAPKSSQPSDTYANFTEALRQESSVPVPYLVAVGFVSFPSSPSSSDEDVDPPSSDKIDTNDEHFFIQADIRKCQFFSYFLNEMSLNTAEATVKQFLPNSVRYFSLGSVESPSSGTPT